MLKALALKELRELAPIAGIALAPYALILAHAVGFDLVIWPASGVQDVPFVTDAFVEQTTFISLCLAIALALRQTLSESARSTWLWLLHRPVERDRVLALKVATGGAIYLACAALPILLFAGWAAWPRTHASPFFWSMTDGAWQAWITVGLTYLGCFLSALRPGRWMGTKLMPLMGTATLAMTMLIFFEGSARRRSGRLPNGRFSHSWGSCWSLASCSSAAYAIIPRDFVPCHAARSFAPFY